MERSVTSVFAENTDRVQTAAPGSFLKRTDVCTNRHKTVIIICLWIWNSRTTNKRSNANNLSKYKQSHFKRNIRIDVFPIFNADNFAAIVVAMQLLSNQ